MSNKTNQKQSESSDNDTNLRRSSRNKSKPKDTEVSLDEPKDMPLCEPSPLSTRNLRNKYVRKPLSEYGKTSSTKDKKVDTDDEYTKILPQNETEMDTCTIDQQSNSNSPFSNYEGQKLSIIPNAEDANIHSAMSPPIGICKTSSPVNSTELFDAPTSAIVGPVARVSRYNSQSSTGSHDESYISTRSEKRTRLNKSKTVTQKSVNVGEISGTSTRETDRSKLKNISKTSLDLSAARKRHEDIKRLYREHETQEHEWMATFLNSGGIIVAILIIALVMKNLLIQKDSFKDSLIQPQTDLTKTAIKSLRDQFPAQTNSTWKVLASNIQRIQRKKSNQAACIVFVNNKARPMNSEDEKTGDARIGFVGFPSVGKSTLLSNLAGVYSEVAAYEFTTLTTVPGCIRYKGAKVQLLDLPGIIEGAKDGKGRGRQVIAVARTASLIFIVLDVLKPLQHKRLIEKELEGFGIRLNKEPPQIGFRRKEKGGVNLQVLCQQSELDIDLVKSILGEYKIHNADVVLRYDATADDLIDVVEGNRIYIPCIYLLNKIDQISVEELDIVSEIPHCVPISAHHKWNYDSLLEKMWDYLKLVRIYTKPKGQLPDYEAPVVLQNGKCSVSNFCDKIHRTLAKEMKYAIVWGSSVKHQPQRVGKDHILHDEDVVQIVKKV